MSSITFNWSGLRANYLMIRQGKDGNEDKLGHCIKDIRQAPVLEMEFNSMLDNDDEGVEMGEEEVMNVKDILKGQTEEEMKQLVCQSSLYHKHTLTHSCSCRLVGHTLSLQPLMLMCVSCYKIIHFALALLAHLAGVWH